MPFSPWPLLLVGAHRHDRISHRHLRRQRVKNINGTTALVKAGEKGNQPNCGVDTGSVVDALGRWHGVMERPFRLREAIKTFKRERNLAQVKREAGKE